MYLEHRREHGGAEQIVHLLVRIQKFQMTALPAKSGVCSYDFSDAGAINEFEIHQIQYQLIFPLGGQGLNGFAKLDVALPHVNSSGAVDNDYVFHLAAALTQPIQPAALDTHADAVQNF